MKKLVAGALALALGFSAFAQEAHELVGSAGKISFGAWGRSTFNIGNQYTSTKIEVTDKVTSTDNGKLAKLAYSTFEANGGKDNALLAGQAAGQAVSTAVYNMVEAQYLAGGADAATAAAYAGAAATAAAAKTEDLITLGGGVSALSALETDESDTEWYASVAPDWSYGCRVGFWIIGRTNDERWGFDFNLDSDAAALFVGATKYDSDTVYADANLKSKNNGVSYAESGKYAVAIGDQAKIWGIFDFNPVDLKVAFGKMREQELRGSIGDFGQRESSDVRSEDDIFTEMWPVLGMFVSAKGQKGTALEGLYAAVDCDAFGLISSESESAYSNKEYNTKLSTLLATVQGGVGYTIPGIAQVKAQFIGDSIEASNKKYAASKYERARADGFGYKDYAGRFEFGIDWLGFAGGATGLGDVDLDKTPNANLIELGVKVPLVLDEDLRQYDPEKFYNFYACLGTMGVIQKGFILYKGHIWGGSGKSDLFNYTMLPGQSDGLLDYHNNPANIVMAGFDALAEVCLNPFGKQNNFAGLSFNYNITLANGDGNAYLGATRQSTTPTTITVNDLKMQKHCFGVEVYLKHTFAANNYFFIGVADRLIVEKMEGTVDFTAYDAGTVDLSYTNTVNKVYIPVGVEMFF